MKKLAMLVFSVAVVFGFLGCSSKNELGNTADFDLSGAPSWVLGSSDSDKTFGVGSAQINNNRTDWAIKEATIKGRADLAATIETKVEEKVKALDSAEGSEMIVAIRSSVEQTLSGAQRTDTWISKGGVLYVKIEIKTIDKKTLDKNLANLSRVNKEAAKALSETVDEIIDGKK
ncbi:LPP20 family lipoprotein [Helicobacter himalayensis]|uniref:LPP20 family lipoprotein n=1 Tax=Helicobacter himalayensis TaxID=1591088 RepID=UPI003D6FD9DB